MGGVAAATVWPCGAFAASRDTGRGVCRHQCTMEAVQIHVSVLGRDWEKCGKVRSVRQSVFVTKLPREVQPSQCEPRVLKMLCWAGCHVLPHVEGAACCVMLCLRHSYPLNAVLCRRAPCTAPHAARFRRAVLLPCCPLTRFAMLCCAELCRRGAVYHPT
jgi:hypothetical protein